jgi:hypothetical protein
MSDTFQTGKTFVTGEQVTATDLNNAVNQAVPKVPLTDDQSITVVNNKLTVKDGDSTNGVPLTKLQHIIGHSVIGNTGSATAAPTNIEVAANEAVLGNSAGNGLITDKIDTDNIKDDAITIAKTSFIADNTATMTLTGTAPRLILDDNGNSGDSPEINGNSTDGNLLLLAEKTGADINVDADDNIILKHNGTEGFRVAADAGKGENGNAAAGAKVTGSLYVTGDIFSDDKLVGDGIIMRGDDPHIIFDQDDVDEPNTSIGCANATASLDMQVKKAEGDVLVSSPDEIVFRVCDDPTSNFDAGSNPYVIRFQVAHDAGKDASGNLSAGAKVTGDLQVTGDLNVADGFSDIKLKSASPKIEFEDTDASVSNAYIQSFNSGTLEVKTEEADSNIELDAKDELFIKYDNTTVFSAGADEGRDSSDSYVPGCKVDGALQVTGEANIGKTKLGTDSILAATPSANDDSTKIATTEFVKDQLNVGGLGYAVLTKSSFSTVNGSGTNDPISGFSISNNGINVTQSGDNVSVPSGVYAITYGIDTCDNPNPGGGSGIYNRMAIKRNGAFQVRNEFEGAEGQNRHAGSLSGVYTGGVNFQFTLGQRNTNNTTNRNVTGNNIRVTIVRIA